MERKYVIILTGISFLLTNVMAFLDEGLRDFEYLKYAGDWVVLVIYTMVFLIIPLLLFFGVKKSYKNRFVFSLFGFLPTVMLILVQFV